MDQRVRGIHTADRCIWSDVNAFINDIGLHYIVFATELILSVSYKKHGIYQSHRKIINTKRLKDWQ